MSFIKVTDAAHGRWRGILIGLGVPAEMLVNRHGPCPICGGETRFRFDDKEGSGSSYCHHCQPSARSGIQLAMDFTGKSFAELRPQIMSLVGHVQAESYTQRRSEEELLAARRSVWAKGSRVVPGDLADKYLTSRGVGQLAYPASLRFAPRISDGDGGLWPCLIAAVQAHDTGRAVTLHRTFLRPDGLGKAEIPIPRKVMAGSHPGGSAVRLSEFSGGPLGIAEGIETALSASRLFDVPVWAALNATLMQKWTPPEGCDEVVIFADNDANHTGQAAAHTLARRLAMKGLATTVHVPPAEGDDWNDVLMKEKADA